MKKLYGVRWRGRDYIRWDMCETQQWPEPLTLKEARKTLAAEIKSDRQYKEVSSIPLVADVGIAVAATLKAERILRVNGHQYIIRRLKP